MAFDSDGQWELGGIEFGVDRDIDHESDIVPASRDIRDQDGTNPVGDGNTFGRDRFTPGVWSFRLFTNGSSQREALDLVEALDEVWRADEVRSQPGEAMALRYRMGGRERVCYGRPRRFDAPFDTRVFAGYIPITCDFKLVDLSYYEDIEDSISLTAAPAQALGGFRAPFRFPLSTAVLTESPGTEMTIGGKRKAPLQIELNGGWVSPTILIDRAGQETISVPILGTIPFGSTVTLDARPWKNELRREGNVDNVALSRGTRMADLRLDPGTYQVSVASANVGDSGTATVRWRKTYGTV